LGHGLYAHNVLKIYHNISICSNSVVSMVNTISSYRCFIQHTHTWKMFNHWQKLFLPYYTTVCSCPAVVRPRLHWSNVFAYSCILWQNALWQKEQVWSYAGHWLWPLLWCASPQPGHVGYLVCGMHCWDLQRAAMTSAVPWLAISEWFFAAYLLWHLEIVVARVRLDSCNKSSIVSPSLSPSIIWSQIFSAKNFWSKICMFWQVPTAILSSCQKVHLVVVFGI